jgi:hypothetical protein
MDYHLEITKRGNCVDFFFFFFRGRGNNILTIFFFVYVLNFPKRYVTFSFLSSWTNFLYDRLLTSQIFFYVIINK